MAIMILLAHPITSYAAQTKDLTLKVTAIEALGNIAEASSVKTLIPYLDDNEFLIQFHTVRALGKITSPDSFKALKKRLANKDKRIAILIAAILSTQQDVVAENIFESGFKDADNLVRLQALKAAGELKIASSMPYLISFLSDNDSYIKAMAIEAIRSINPKNKEACDIISKMAEDSSHEIRKNAVLVLGESSNRKFIPLIIKRLDDNNETVAASAKISIAKLGYKPPAQKKKKTQKEKEETPLDKNSLLYIAQIQIKAESSDFSVIRELIDNIKSPEAKTFLRVKSVSVLKILKDKLYPQTAKDGKKKDKPRAKNNYTDADFEADGKPITDLFTAALKDASSAFHKDAPFALAAWGDQAAIPCLIEALDSMPQDDAYKSGIVYALGCLHAKPAVKAIEAIISKE